MTFLQRNKVDSQSVHGTAQQLGAEADVASGLQLVPREHPQLDARLTSRKDISDLPLKQ